MPGPQAVTFGRGSMVLVATALLAGCPMSDAYFVDPDYGTGADAANGDARPPMDAKPMDTCPDDPTKTSPGKCGCGMRETALCLVHRYSFDGTDTVLLDSAGSASGTAMNCTQSNRSVTLSGAGQYINLPGGIISQLSSGTIEAWITWTAGGGSWQRIFDFGSSSASPGTPGATGVSYLFFTPENEYTHSIEVTYSEAGIRGETTIRSTSALRTGVMTHVAVVVDVPQKRLALYVDGVLQAVTSTFPGSLARLHDVNNWIGRSQFYNDPYLQGTIHELRIYSVPRTALQIGAETGAGPDTLPNL